jgi:hypothetical protein
MCSSAMRLCSMKLADQPAACLGIKSAGINLLLAWVSKANNDE